MEKALEVCTNDWDVQEARRLLALSRRVIVRYNDDTGEKLWSVESEENREFWFNAFLTQKQAVQWAADAGLVIVGTEYDNV